MMKSCCPDSRLFCLAAAALLLSLEGCVVQPVDPIHPSAATGDIDASVRSTLSDERSRIEIGFTSEDRRYIHDYYYREHDGDRNGRKHLPPGLAKRDTLPPGLQQQIRRNGRLPPGLQGRRLPDALEYRLSPLPPNYIRLRVGRDIVLMEQRTRITVDVIKNVFP